MNVRIELGCDVCGTGTLVRLQVGWLDQHPVRIHCPECGILMSGYVRFDQENATGSYKFDNATERSARPSFFVEASGELLTEKVRQFDPDNDYFPPPFFKTTWAMGRAGYEQFAGKVQAFRHAIEDEWPRVRRMNELWLSGEHGYLSSELANFDEDGTYDSNDTRHLLASLRRINIAFLSPMFDIDRLKETQRWLAEELNALLETKQTGFRELCQKLVDSGFVDLLESRFLDLVGEFVARFEFLIPAYGLRFYEDRPADLLDRMGITTASVNDLKQFYVDGFELGSDITVPIVALNNVALRNHYDAMADRRGTSGNLPRITSLDAYIGATKGRRLDFVDGSETFDRLLLPFTLDNRLRNIFAHNSYGYDGRSQDVALIEKGKHRATPSAPRMYLVEFAERCLEQFVAIAERGLELVTYVHLTELAKIPPLPQSKLNPSGSGGVRSARPEGRVARKKRGRDRK